MTKVSASKERVKPVFFEKGGDRMKNIVNPNQNALSEGFDLGLHNISFSVQIFILILYFQLQ